jgi:hypothetical protein
MSRAAPQRPRASTPKAEADDSLTDEDVGTPTDKVPEEIDEEEGADELAEESGLDLTDASDLDADNVPADEEFDRVMQAPD